jgi:hypothetical protein
MTTPSYFWRQKHFLVPKWRLERVDLGWWILFEKDWSELLDPKAKVAKYLT